MRRGSTLAQCLLIVISFLVASAAAGKVSESAEGPDSLYDRHRQLERRVAELEREQEFLLFQRVFQRSDSKYLILDLARGKGTLKYRNRVLRSFRIVRVGGKKRSPGPGAVLLTEKRDRFGKKRALVFGNDLILQGSRRHQPSDPIPRYALGSKDLAAISYAIEVGAMGYIVPW